MDPDANLKEQREIVERFKEIENLEDAARDGARLAELVAALDEWISRGGFYPKSWTNTKRKK